MIGIFDSGYGGLSVFKELISAFPEYSFMYLGDNARAPYGIRSKEIVTEYVSEACAWLFDHGADAVVLACNTASADALPELSKKFGEKMILGVIEPTVEYVANSVKKSEAIAVIATPATIRSGAYRAGLVTQGFTKIVERPAPLLVPLVETGDVVGPVAEHIIRDALAPLTREGIEHVILGCTHYYFLRDTIEKLYPHVKLYDASGSFPVFFQKFLVKHTGLLKKERMISLPKFYTTDEENTFARFVEKRLGLSVSPERVRLV